MSPWRGAHRDRHELAAAWRDPATPARPGGNDAGAPTADDGGDRDRRVACRPPVGALTTLRSSSADAVATRDEPVMVGAQRLYGRCRTPTPPRRRPTSAAGPSPRPCGRATSPTCARQACSSRTWHAASRDPTSPPRSSAIAADLPVYSGLMETARANNRQGLPVGAAYVRQASRTHARQDAAGLRHASTPPRPSACRPSTHRHGSSDSLIFVVIAFGGVLAVVVRPRSTSRSARTAASTSRSSRDRRARRA